MTVTNIKLHQTTSLQELFQRLPCRLGQYGNITFGPEVVRILQDRIGNTVSMFWVAHAIHPDQVTNGDEKHNSNKDDDGQRQKNLNRNKTRQYVVDHIVRQLETLTGTNYPIRCYENTTDNDITEPAENVPVTFVSLIDDGCTDHGR